MQTFLPSKSFWKSARILDSRRLGKQRVEAMQILRVLLDENPVTRQPTTSGMGWRNHPAVRMWRGHEGSLYRYMTIMCDEWVRRGYGNEKMEEHRTDIWRLNMTTLILCSDDPRWLGNVALHASHRSNLLRKDPQFYSRFKWNEPADMEYVWPTV